MTKILGRDPRRRCKRVAEWPEDDQLRRTRALAGGDLLDDCGPLAGYSAPFLRRLDAGYGRWLQWLDMRGELDPAMPPGARVTRQRIADYIRDLRQANATKTVIGRLDELLYMCQALDPGHDLAWLLPMTKVLRAGNVPARPKIQRLVDVGELFRLGLRLMEQGPAANTGLRRLRQYRDGLIIAVLAACPMRLRNLAMLRLDLHVRRQGEVWWIDVPAKDTKTGVRILCPLPTELTAFLERYLADYRPVLIARWNGLYERPGDALWISGEGAAMSYDSFYMPIMRATRKAFGQPVNPHLFRDCAATSVAIHDPTHVRIIASILGHQSLATSERHYNQARSLEAARHWQDWILALRGQAEPPAMISNDP